MPFSALVPRPGGTIRSIDPVELREVVVVVAAPHDELVQHFVRDLKGRGLPASRTSSCTIRCQGWPLARARRRLSSWKDDGRAISRPRWRCRQGRAVTTARSRTGLGSETEPDEALGRLAPACPRVSCALGSDWTVPRIFFHAYQFQAEVAKSVKDAVKVGLIMDLADEGALFVARFQGKSLECGRKASGEAPPDCDPVPGRLHVTPGVLWVGAHLEPTPDER